MYPEFKRYNPNRFAPQGVIAITLHSLESDAEDFLFKGEQIMTATINPDERNLNAPDSKYTRDTVFIKDYSENEGILAALIEAGIVEQPHRRITQGFVTVPVCKLTSEAVQQYSSSNPE